jgi:hypothetical protein
MWRFLTHPVFTIIGIVGALASIIALPVSYSFYLLGQQTPDLVYTVNPVKTVLAHSRSSTHVQVFFMGEPITGVDVVAMQFAFWNQGKASIRNPLETIEIRLTPSITVLDVSVNKTSRNVIELNVSKDREMWRQGRIPLHWKILERNDGASLQIIYAGSKETEAKLTGVIEGQGSPRNLPPILKIQSPEEQLTRGKIPRGPLIIIGIKVAILSVGMLFPVVRAIKDYSQDKRLTRAIIVVIMTTTALSYLVAAIVLVFILKTPLTEPPFGF